MVYMGVGGGGQLFMVGGIMVVNFNHKGWGLTASSVSGGHILRVGGGGSAHTLWGMPKLLFLRQNPSMMIMEW